MFCFYISFADATSSAVASFSDARCTAGGVCPNDPLVYTCEVNSYLMRIILPSGVQEVASIGDTESDILFPSAGFNVYTFNVTPVDIFRRNYTPTLSIENASLLNGGQIICDDTENIVANARCPLIGEPHVSKVSLYSIFIKDRHKCLGNNVQTYRSDICCACNDTSPMYNDA